MCLRKEKVNLKPGDGDKYSGATADLKRGIRRRRKPGKCRFKPGNLWMLFVKRTKEPRGSRINCKSQICNLTISLPPPLTEAAAEVLPCFWSAATFMSLLSLMY